MNGDQTAWYHAKDSIQHGPMSAEALKELFRQGAIGGETLVWNAGMAGWEPFSVTALGAGLLAVAPAVVAAPPLLPVPPETTGREPQPDISVGTTAEEDAQTRNRLLSHEASIRSVGSLYLLGGSLLLLSSLVQALGSLLGGATEWMANSLLILVLLLLSGAQLALGFGLRRLRRWSRIPATVVAAIGLIAFPFGTLVNGYILYLLLSKKGAEVFSEGYLRVVERTPHIRYRTSPFVKILLAVLLLLILAGFAAAFLKDSWK